MAYDARQRQIMAYALALSGGHVASALRWLKANTVECGDVGESTLRRLCEDEAFGADIEHQAKLIGEERDAQVRELERTRLKNDATANFFERVRGMERKGWELLDRLSTEMEKPDTDRKELLAFWRTMQGYIIDLRKQAGGGIHELWQAEVLVRATREVLQGKFGLALADQTLKEVSKRYDAMATERQAKEAANAAPEKTASA